MGRPRVTSALVAAALAFVLWGCNPNALSIQAQTANLVASAANSALPILVERYRREGDAAIARSGDRAEAEAAVAAVKDKWSPVWTAWEALRIAEDGWAATLEQGGDAKAALGALRDAYCALLGAWPNDVPAIPLAPIRCPSLPDDLAPTLPDVPGAPAPPVSGVRTTSEREAS